MSFDLLDNTFLKHVAAPGKLAASNALPNLNTTSESRVTEVPEFATMLVTDRVLASLLTTSPDQWWALVDRVAEARRSGVRSIAVAGHRPGEGRSTLVHGLELMLPHLGFSVRSYASSAEWWQELLGEAEYLQWQQGKVEKENELVLVDAGVWFPPGRIRLRPLRLASFGFDAVIAVRREGEEACPAYAAALVEAGLSVLGEVVCFATPSAARAA